MSLSPLETATLAVFRDRLGARFGERLGRLVLFGSRARGGGDADSDLDLLVLISQLTPGERREVLDIAFDLELSTGLFVEPLVRDATAWREDSALGREIARDGVPL